MFNDGANEGYWRFQIRDKHGRWVEMGGGVTFNTNHPNYGPMKGVGFFDGGSGPGVARIKVTDSKGIKPGVYEIPAEDIESAKAIIPINAPGLAQAKKLDAADGVVANPVAPATEAPKKELTAQERETLLRFTDTGYAPVSNKLRRGMEVSPQVEADIETLINLINSSKATEDRVIYRGTLTSNESWADQLNTLEIGDVLVDPGIGSASPDVKVAENFATMDVGSTPKARALFTLNVPKGSAAFDIPDKAHSYISETETLLPPGTSIKVTGIEKRDGVKYITADVIGAIDVVDESAEERGSAWATIDDANGISGKGDDSVFDKALKGNKFDLKALGGTYQPAEDLEMFNDTDKQAVRAYTSSNAFKVWNRVLRGGDAAELTKNKEGIDQLDAAIADHGEVFGKDTTVYRGFRIQPGKADWKSIVENLNVDDVMTDDAYMSTSNSPEVAYGGFGAAAGWGVTDGDYNSDFEGSDGSIFWSIKLPEGSTAMGIPPELGYHGDSEDEVLLPRGSQVRVKSIRKVQQRTVSGEPKPGIYNYFLETEYIGAKATPIEAPKPGEEPIRVEG